jgi:hypothetical protein
MLEVKIDKEGKKLHYRSKTLLTAAEWKKPSAN